MVATEGLFIGNIFYPCLLFTPSKRSKVSLAKPWFDRYVWTKPKTFESVTYENIYIVFNTILIFLL